MYVRVTLYAYANETRFHERAASVMQIGGVGEEELEAEHVHNVYSKIASHFSDTRYKPWPRVAQFLQQLPPGSFVADVGASP